MTKSAQTSRLMARRRSLYSALLLATCGLSVPASAQWSCRADTAAEGWHCTESSDDTASQNASRSLRQREAADDTTPQTSAIAESYAGVMDWVPLEQVPEELRTDLCVLCEGRYIDPLAPEVAGRIPEESAIEAEAARSQLQGNIITMTGGVNVQQGYRRLQSEQATLDRVQRTGSLAGDIVFREPGVVVRGQSADIDSRTGEARIEQSRFVLHEEHMRGTANVLRRDDKGIIHVEKGDITYCAPGDTHWLLSAEKLRLNTGTGRGVARKAKLELGDVPVIWLPWLSFPLDDRRTTGFLWPEFGSDTVGGIDIAVPVYFNLAPNYDLMYAPRFIEERGFNHQFEARYLGRWLGEWSVGGAYLPDDERFEDQFPSLEDHDRWLVELQHQGLLGQRWRSRVDYSEASDAYYLKDLDVSNLNAKRRTTLLQFASMDYLGDDWLMQLEVQRFQTLTGGFNNNYRKMPQFTAEYRGHGEAFNLNPILLAQYSNFDTNTGQVTGQRLYGEAGATYPMRWAFGYLEPTVKYRQLKYDLNDIGTNEGLQPSAGSALASIDTGLIFERGMNLFDKNLLQTLEPRLYYVYGEYERQADLPDFDSAELTFTYNQLFRETRFSGHDRLDDANQIAAGITTRFIDARDGREYMSASLGQIYYFDDRRVRLRGTAPALDASNSAIAGEMRFAPNEAFGISAGLVFDTESEKVDTGSFLAHYKAAEDAIVNVGYTFRRPQNPDAVQPITGQAELSAYFPLNRNWRFFGAWRYSTESDRSIEDMVGLEYDTCCWKIRLMHLRYFDIAQGVVPDFDDPDLEREQSTQIQFVLKGMGGLGERVSGIMEDMIRGFRERDY